MLYLSNAFSIQMLSINTKLSFSRISTSEAQLLTHDAIQNNIFQGVIGHADTANVVANELGISLNLNNRISLKLKAKSDILIVAQLTGGRLPEGTTTLPDGFKIEYWLVQDLD